MKNNKFNSGIYKITCIINNKFYIGSAIDFVQRFYVHKSSLRRGKHHSKYLQRSWNKYGEDKFIFEILVTCPEEYLIKMEQWFLDNMKPEYNTLKIAGSLLGFNHSLSTRLKFSNRMKTYKHSKETIEKLSRANKPKRSVLKYDLYGNFIEKYDSLTKAAKSINRDISTISDCLSGRSKQSQGYIFKYADLEEIKVSKSRTKIKSNKRILLKMAKLIDKCTPSSFVELYESLGLSGNYTDKELTKRLDELIDGNK